MKPQTGGNLPPLQPEEFLTVAAILEEADEKINSGVGVSPEELAALVWRSTGLPTAPVGPTAKRNGWILAMRPAPLQRQPEFFTLAQIFQKRARWIQRDGAITSFISLLEREQDKQVCRDAAFGTDDFHQAPPESARERLARQEEEQRKRREAALLARQKIASLSGTMPTIPTHPDALAMRQRQAAEQERKEQLRAQALTLVAGGLVEKFMDESPVS